MRMRAAVVIVEDGRVALIERVRDQRTYFKFPGGRVEDGESPQQAAVREAHEELGVSVELGDLISVAYRDGRESDTTSRVSQEVRSARDGALR